MGLNDFLRFHTDFDIFPSLLSNPMITSIFGSICNKLQISKSVCDMYIKKESFTMSVAICGLAVVYLPVDPPYKEKVSSLIRYAK